MKKVDKGGYSDTSVQIRLLPERLRSLGISPLAVQQRLEQANRDMSWGEFDSGRSVIQLYMAGRFDDIEQLKKLPIHRMGDNRVVHLKKWLRFIKGWIVPVPKPGSLCREQITPVVSPWGLKNVLVPIRWL